METEGGEDLTIDVGILGWESDPALVLSSGVHGVEGFPGSALQLAFLDGLYRKPAGSGIRYILIHGINPHGFAHLRRFNEGNVDLNRNFLGGKNEYSGVRDGYARLVSTACSIRSRYPPGLSPSRRGSL
ncbi:MAG: DUF2817 domain-containing protein [Akkermansiaceae bacterium]|nr:DUF2817 domain-containing protein [Akkermansiaceae bacterium]